VAIAGLAADGSEDVFVRMLQPVFCKDLSSGGWNVEASERPVDWQPRPSEQRDRCDGQR